MWSKSVSISAYKSYNSLTGTEAYPGALNAQLGYNLAKHPYINALLISLLILIVFKFHVACYALEAAANLSKCRNVSQHSYTRNYFNEGTLGDYKGLSFCDVFLNGLQDGGVLLKHTAFWESCLSYTFPSLASLMSLNNCWQPWALILFAWNSSYPCLWHFRGLWKSIN